MVLYATIMPSAVEDLHTSDLYQDILKFAINILEVGVIYQALSIRNSFQEKEIKMKVLAVGLTWCFAEAFYTNLLYFLMNATGEEFKWEFIQTALYSNIEMIEKLALVALIEILRRLALQNKNNFLLVFLILIKYIVGEIVFKHAEFIKTDDPWKMLSYRAAFGILYGLVAK